MIKKDAVLLKDDELGQVAGGVPDSLLDISKIGSRDGTTAACRIIDIRNYLVNIDHAEPDAAVIETFKGLKNIMKHYHGVRNYSISEAEGILNNYKI